jgi:hypothetical protein
MVSPISGSFLLIIRKKSCILHLKFYENDKKSCRKYTDSWFRLGAWRNLIVAFQHRRSHGVPQDYLVQTFVINCGAMVGSVLRP